MASLTKSLNFNAEDLLGIIKFSGKSKKGILWPSTIVLMIKSEAQVKLDQKSTCSLRALRLEYCFFDGISYGRYFKAALAASY